MSIPADDPTALSRLFHLNSEPWMNEAAYRAGPYLQQFRSHPGAPRLPLPPTDPGGVEALAMARRSTRAYRPEPLPLAMLARLLRAGYGVSGPERFDSGGRFLRRSVPSAGGTYPLEIYALVARVQGLAPGIHHYDADGEAIEALRPGPWQQAAEDIFYTWPFVAQAPVILCLAAIFGRTQRKYGPRGYRYVLLEAGHVAQNLCLAAAELGLASLCMGGFRDARLNALIGLRPPEEGVVYTLAIGEAATGPEAPPAAG
ncbi:SagB/ThcOx family dehydrogenase [Paracoccus siganidrum]|uniref:SagB/ThcOx family dehydrogenase n=1 Tax=Paracoccus siganidrum TaxID=1276757 RepID=A0A419A7F7_9RHOB|nr:SagB/ThcOx family dehydrogenase [Paracoccus siganidrum]RJL16506.1 SagB/ThcOx family dehydrogenase [Paracoccus siganidrum]RMC38246.1 nitroreductase [Paracoccus siganidrum]